MTATEPVQRIDLTAPAERLTYVEILTPAGTVRVNTGLVNWRTDQPAVSVEIKPANEYNRRGAPGENWDAEVREVALGSRIDVTLTRQPVQPVPPRRDSNRDERAPG
jgi:hypothetical protein